MRSARAYVRAWRSMRLLMGMGFLGFGCGKPLSTSVWLVSSRKASICTNLMIGGAQLAWLVDLRHGCEQRWLYDFVESKSRRQQGKWLDGGLIYVVHVENFFIV